MNVKQLIFGLSLAILAAEAGAADVLAGKNGMTLYTFDPDGTGKSACSGRCLSVWPAARPGDAGGKDFGEMTRDDGSRQLTYKGKPLYYYAGDKKPGDKIGDNVENVWHVVSKTAKTGGTGSNSGGTGYSY